MLALTLTNPAFSQKDSSITFTNLAGEKVTYTLLCGSNRTQVELLNEDDPTWEDSLVFTKKHAHTVIEFGFESPIYIYYNYKKSSNNKYLFYFDCDERDIIINRKSVENKVKETT